MNEAIAKYIEAIKADYARFSQVKPDADAHSIAWNKKATEEFNAGIQVRIGKKYLKVVTKSGSSNSVHSFIVVEDDGKFKKGDILKAAGWNTPAKNVARGNIFGEFHTNWTGADYLR